MISGIFNNTTIPVLQEVAAFTQSRQGVLSPAKNLTHVSCRQTQ